VADEDEDWFERALREDEEESTDDTPTDGDAADADATTDTDEATDGPGGSDDVPETDEEAANPFTSSGDERDSDEAGEAEDGDGNPGVVEDEAAVADVTDDDAATGDDPFTDGPGFADAMDAAPDAGSGSEGDDLFEEDFADALGGDDPGGGFGFDLGDGGGGSLGGGGGFDEGEFDDEEFDSDIPRIKLGIEGLDSMIQGGVPERSLMVVMGSAGTGKTTFGLQFLNEALESDENAVFVTLEETRQRILSTADEKGWEFERYVEEDRLAVIDLDPIEMANSLTSIRNDLPVLIEEFGATRLVLDSVSLLEMMYDDQASRRSEIYDFTRSLKEAGVTTMLTSEASDDNPFVSRYGIIEYLVDAVLVLRYVRPEDFRETRLAVEIQKIRDANHSRETKPYEITNSGISVYRQANIF